MGESSKRVLVVDDKADIVETVSFCLAQEGYEIFTAFDGQQALDVARREQPDVIVLDVMLPKENGYQVARFLREDWKGGILEKKPRILLLTARTVFDGQREEFLQTWSGADAFMYKPFDLDELILRVKGMLLEGESAVSDAMLSR